MSVRRVVTVPFWEERPEVEGELLLRLNLGKGDQTAFGFGSHPTTSMALALLGGLYGPAAPKPRRVLDVGCGSGILGIAAARLGATEVLGIDPAPAAMSVAPENAVRNGVGDRCRFEPTLVGEVPGTFDLVLANLTAPLFADLHEAVCARARGGFLIVSGFNDLRLDIEDCFLGGQLKNRLWRAGWRALLLRYRE